MNNEKQDRLLELVDLLAAAVAVLIEHNIPEAYTAIIKRLDRILSSAGQSDANEIVFLRSALFALKVAAAMKHGKYREASTLAREGVNNAPPGDVQYYLFTGELMQALHRQGDNTAALQELCEALRVAVDTGTTREAAKLLWMLGEWNLDVDMANKVAADVFSFAHSCGLDDQELRNLWQSDYRKATRRVTHLLVGSCGG